MEVLAAQRLDKFYKCEMAKKPSSLFSVIIINVNIAHKHAHFLAIPVVDFVRPSLLTTENGAINVTIQLVVSSFTRGKKFLREPKDGTTCL